MQKVTGKWSQETDLHGSEEGKIRQREELAYNLVAIKSLANHRVRWDSHLELFQNKEKELYLCSSQSAIVALVSPSERVITLGKSVLIEEHSCEPQQLIFSEAEDRYFISQLGLP